MALYDTETVLATAASVPLCSCLCCEVLRRTYCETNYYLWFSGSDVETCQSCRAVQRSSWRNSGASRRSHIKCGRTALTVSLAVSVGLKSSTDRK
jgi:hypothetical protein